jgi:competence ComEA-like helix-hairpin-helix protein
MENTRLKWREAFTFTRSEQRGFRILTIILLLTIVARVAYFRCVEPPRIQFKIPAAWLKSDTTQFEDDNSSDTARNDLGYAFAQVKKNTRYWHDSIPAKNYAQPFKRSRMIELNTADTLELRSLPSIGPWLARKITEYRDRLGGYYRAEQLLEVYRLTPGKLDTIAPFLVVDTSWVKRIDINGVTTDELLKHPYLSRSQAKALIAYREKHGAYASVVDLKKCLLIDEKTFEKVRDYVEVR